MRQIVLDTETTGLEFNNGHRIIEIGCVELINRRFTGNNYHSYLNPERDVDRDALKVHGITSAFLTNKPRFTEIYSDLIAYVQGAEIIIHNAAFDIGFLNYEIQLISKHNPLFEQHCKIVDTLTMARKLHPGQRNSLDALCKRYSIDNSQRDFHGALLDAKILAQVYLAMTGGQSSLFESPLSNENIPSAQTQNPETQNFPLWDLPLVLANEEEDQTHQNYLTMLLEKSGKVLWTND